MDRTTDQGNSIQPRLSISHHRNRSVGSGTGQEAKSSDAGNTDVLRAFWPSRLSAERRDQTAFRSPSLDLVPTQSCWAPSHLFAIRASRTSEWAGGSGWPKTPSPGGPFPLPVPPFCTSNIHPITGTPLPPSSRCQYLLILAPLSTCITSAHYPPEVGHGPRPPASSFRKLRYRSHQNVPIPRSHVCPNSMYPIFVQALVDQPPLPIQG